MAYYDDLLDPFGSLSVSRGGSPNNVRYLKDGADPMSRRQKKEDPIERAARIQAEAADEGIEYIDPFYQAGVNQLEQQQQASTPAGMDAIIRQIMDTGIYGGLYDDRMQAVQGQLGASGLRRSGAGLEAAAAVPTDIALGIEQELYGRGNETTRQGMLSSFSIADLLSRSAEATASGILGVEQAKNMEKSSKRDMFGNIISAGLMGFGGGLFGK